MTEDTSDDQATAPMPEAGAAQRADTTTSAGDPSRVGRRPATFGTIFWGVLLLVFAAVMVVTALPFVVVDTMTAVILAVIAAGLLLVAAGVAAALRR